MSRHARVAFVGAGPGDPELVTLKALRRLREADVVIHDRLAPVELLHEARADAEIIDAGKAPGRCRAFGGCGGPYRGPPRQRSGQ